VWITLVWVSKSFSLSGAEMLKSSINDHQSSTRALAKGPWWQGRSGHRSDILLQHNDLLSLKELLPARVGGEWKRELLGNRRECGERCSLLVIMKLPYHYPVLVKTVARPLSKLDTGPRTTFLSRRPPLPFSPPSPFGSHPQRRQLHYYLCAPTCILTQT
jgi:hypothetical protein